MKNKLSAKSMRQLKSALLHTNAAYSMIATLGGAEYDIVREVFYNIYTKKTNEVSPHMPCNTIAAFTETLAETIEKIEGK